ncbi:BLOC-1-related complex subunit 6 isoform X1 [Frankliniella occidentalis]|uniref:BLOC-1-related complex subunit 6 isoform X1 n=2 Tax=Frankliniella occidentalis TaxID=133901 RepID=A0A6J1SQ65_FRAOC|nr:BLOC-1-related complex subunit 6 isoform X1 [Frankliniella occidentalis]
MSSALNKESTTRECKVNRNSNAVLKNANIEEEDGYDDQKPDEMTASYSEISMDSLQSPSVDWLPPDVEDSFQRPDRLELRGMDADYLEDLDGTITREGDMVFFVAEDLEAKIKLSSPKTADAPPFTGSRSATPCLHRQALSAPQLSPIDPYILNDLENEARRIASSVDTLTESLAGILRSISALTVDCVEIYRDAVCKTCDAVDSNIKAMYQLMAKCEELSKSMKPIYKLAEDIKEVKRLLDMLESAVNS